MALDFRLPGVVNWFANNIRNWAGNGNFDGFSADMLALHNVNYACSFTSQNEFSAAMDAWAHNLSAQIAPIGLVGNVSLYDIYTQQELVQFGAEVTGILDEQGFTAYAAFTQARIGDPSWSNKVAKMVALQQQGTNVFSVNYVREFPPQRSDPLGDVNWVVGSMLMARDRHAFVVIYNQNHNSNTFTEWPHLDVYDQDFGHPCGPMQFSNGLYTRTLSKSIAVVNASADSATYSVPPGMQDLYGNNVMSGPLNLPSLSAKVLLTSTAQCP